ncbi:MAG: PQQ-binding-like beta-propeller repeat protein, partial [bacterium]|nr:PQQ-binding-like beta-propeller repeat protein [bacterium]
MSYLGEMQWRVGLVALVVVVAALGGDWPSFRGPGASGVADGQRLPDKFGGEAGKNILWKTPIPGLAHSSPVVWGDKLILTTAITSKASATFKPGLYGAG